MDGIINLASNRLDHKQQFNTFDFSKLNILIPHQLASMVTFPNFFADTPEHIYGRLRVIQLIVEHYMADGLVEFVDYVINESNNQATIASIMKILDNEGKSIELVMPCDSKNKTNGGGGRGGGGGGGRGGGGGGRGGGGGGRGGGDSKSSVTIYIDIIYMQFI